MLPPNYKEPTLEWASFTQDLIRIRYKFEDEKKDLVRYEVYDGDTGQEGHGVCTVEAFKQAIRASFDDEELTDEEYALAEEAVKGCTVRWIP